MLLLKQSIVYSSSAYVRHIFRRVRHNYIITFYSQRDPDCHVYTYQSR